jgi:hypothetical protein
MSVVDLKERHRNLGYLLSEGTGDFLRSPKQPNPTTLAKPERLTKLPGIA